MSTLDEAAFVELNDMLDKILLTKYTDVLARNRLGVPALLALAATGEVEKRLQRCGIFKGPRDAIVAELRLLPGSGRRAAAAAASAAAPAPAADDDDDGEKADTLAELQASTVRQPRWAPAAASAEGINGPADGVERRRRSTMPTLGAGDRPRRGSASIEPSVMGRMVSSVRNVVDGTSNPEADGGSEFYKPDGTLRESEGATCFSEDSPLWAPTTNEPTGQDVLDRLFKSPDKQAEQTKHDKQACEQALAAMAAKTAQHQPTQAAGAAGMGVGGEAVEARGVVVDADAAEISYMGRFDRRIGSAVRFDWAGSTISVRFTGSKSIAVRLAGAGNFFNIVIDDCMTATIFADDDSRDPILHSLADGLAADQEHTLTITKRTEPIGTSFLITRDSARACTFRGFILEPAGSLVRHTRISTLQNLIPGVLLRTLLRSYRHRRCLHGSCCS